MADVRGSQQHKHQQHYGGIGGDQQIHPHQFYGGGDQLSQLHQYTSPDVSKSSFFPQQGPSASQIIAVVTLVPLGGTLLLLAGLTLAGTFLGLALSTPLFLIFSPILVPAIITVGLAVAGILISGAFGITGLSSFSWLSNFLRQTHLPQQAIRGAQETTDQLSQKARDMGQTISDKAHDVSQNIQSKAQDVGQNLQSKAQETGQKAHDAGHTGRTHEGGRARDVKVT